MWLTGAADGPALGPPAPLLALLDSLVARIADASALVGTRVSIDPMEALTERAAWAGRGRAGTTSCGGATRLLRALDGRVAITLARAEDVAAVPAFTELPRGGDPWLPVEQYCASAPMATIVARADLLGLPVGALGEQSADDAVVVRDGVVDAVGEAAGGGGRAASGLEGSGRVASGFEGSGRVASGRVASGFEGSGRVASGRVASSIVVADLSAMWAGPLCGAILAAAGCTVVKIESATRPDGARRGPPAFFERLHRGKQFTTFDFETAADRIRLRDTLAASDVVIEASRPRALLQLGIDRAELQSSGPAVWLTITGHGAARNRVGFGDDAAVAGGLVAWDGDRPCFVADAVADPITGLLAAAEVLEALAAGARRYLDVAMAGVAALAAGPTVPVPAELVPRPPPIPGQARGGGPGFWG